MARTPTPPKTTTCSNMKLTVDLQYYHTEFLTKDIIRNEKAPPSGLTTGTGILYDVLLVLFLHLVVS